MSTQPVTCMRWQGRPSQYQHAAFDLLHDAGRRPATYSWITASCAEPMCLDVDHLVICAPLRIDYPPFVCVYCGLPGGTRDHLVPRGISGNTARLFVATVPACGECNGLLGDFLAFSITERREEAHRKLRRKSAMRTKDFTPAELREFGPTLRATVQRGIQDKRAILARLDWPTDPAYDLRAFQKSGIEDPYAAGLIV